MNKMDSQRVLRAHTGQTKREQCNPPLLHSNVSSNVSKCVFHLQIPNAVLNDGSC